MLLRFPQEWAVFRVSWEQWPSQNHSNVDAASCSNLLTTMQLCQLESAKDLTLRHEKQNHHA